MFGMQHPAPFSSPGIRQPHHHCQRCWLRGHIMFQSRVIHLSRKAASEISSRGVRVHTISPGAIVTAIFTEAAGQDELKADRVLRAVRRAV